MSQVDLALNLTKYQAIVDRAHLSEDSGKVTQVVGQMMLAYLPGAAVGSI